jgi:hypothetical protein
MKSNSTILLVSLSKMKAFQVENSGDSLLEPLNIDIQSFLLFLRISEILLSLSKKITFSWVLLSVS